MLHHLITTYGYWAILIITFFEGEAIVVLAGVAARHHYLELPLVMAVAGVGTFLGDQLYFHIGHRIGPAVFERRPSWRAGAERLYGLLNRHETLLVLTFRFLYGLRTIASFVFGAARMSRTRFLVLNAAGALLWAVLISYGGFLFGSLFQRFFDGFEHYFLEILGVLIVLAAAFVGFRIWRRRRGSRAS
ncbi:MAG: DedA family protein [Acidiferrobacteraceae bacterium]